MHLLINFFCFLLPLLLHNLITASTDRTCSDDLYQDCKQRAVRGECNVSNDQDIIIKMLAECRQTCNKVWRDTPDWLDSKYGGLGDSVTDQFGFSHHLCGPQGLTAKGRASLLQIHLQNIEQPEWVPMFNEIGFQKVQIPAKLWETLSEYYEKMIPMFEEVIYDSWSLDHMLVEENARESSLKPVSPYFLMELDLWLVEELESVLKPLAEDWSGMLLENFTVYDVRRYTNGAWVGAHVDQMDDLVIGAIINMGQEVKVDWPLFIKDNQGNDHQVLLKPGQMVWLEGARLIHGRLIPLNGNFYDNMFVYFKPRGVWYEKTFEIGGKPREEGPLTKEMIIATY